MASCANWLSLNPDKPAALARVNTPPAPFRSSGEWIPRTRWSPSVTYSVFVASWYAKPVGDLICAKRGSATSAYPPRPLPAYVQTPFTEKSTARIRWFPRSAMKSNPSSENTKPCGSFNTLLNAGPSSKPASVDDPPPTTVTTSCVLRSIFRTRLFPESETNTSSVFGFCTTPDGLWKDARPATPSLNPKTPQPATVVT